MISKEGNVVIRAEVPTELILVDLPEQYAVNK